jgi:ethanolamine utilization protein EutN
MCRVLGPMWATVKHPAFAGATRCSWCSRSTSTAPTSAPSFVALDRAQAGVGDRVIVLTEGTGVRQLVKQGDIVPVRSVIVGVVDAVDTGATPAPGAGR